MNETDILNIIHNQLGDEYIGDDCAYLKDIGIVISQDSLIEDIHFKTQWCTPFQLGYKSVVVNISDILASGAIPKYVTIALSLPNNIKSDYINEFYKGAKFALKDAKIVGGDITGSNDKIAISVTAIGITGNRNISSRSNAKDGYIVITKGFHGSSAAGLEQLKNKGSDEKLILAHLMPELEYDFSESISVNVMEPYAMMDTSDGLADALFKIAESSNVKIIADYNKIPHLGNVTKNQVYFGGEDYKLIAAIPSGYFNKIDGAVEIGSVVKYDGVRLDISGDKYSNYTKLDTYNHFSDN